MKRIILGLITLCLLTLQPTVARSQHRHTPIYREETSRPTYCFMILTSNTEIKRTCAPTLSECRNLELQHQGRHIILVECSQYYRGNYANNQL